MPEVPRTNARLYYNVGDILHGENAGEAFYIMEVRDDSIIIEPRLPSITRLSSPPQESPPEGTVWYEPTTEGAADEDDSPQPITPVVWEGLLESNASNVAAAINSPGILPAEWQPRSRRGPKRVMITGSRDWKDEEKIRKELSALQETTTIVHGNARGADKIADRIARELGLEVEVFRADWKGEGKKAGIMRNLRMVNSGIHRVIAFWDGESRGTAHAIYAAKEEGIRTKVVYPQGVCDER